MAGKMKKAMKVASKKVASKTVVKKKVDWAAAGRKAYATRIRNQKIGKTAKPKPKLKPKKPISADKSKRPQVKHSKQIKTIGFGNFRVNREDLVKALQAHKEQEIPPTVVTQITWKCIKDANPKAFAKNSDRKHK